MHRKSQRDLDPLDLELMERAFESALAAAKGNNVLTGELECDEELEANLLREITEIALVNGVSDAETLRDILLTKLLRRRIAG